MWCLELESNQRPPDFQSSTLPAELSKHMVGREGLEPPMYLTSRVYSPLRSPNFATYRQMVLQVGFEPTTPRLEGACSSPLSYWSIYELFATIWINSNLTLRQGSAYSFTYASTWNKPTKWWTRLGIEPRTPRCKRGVIPFNYQPISGAE